jgi:hypothetical protein
MVWVKGVALCGGGVKNIYVGSLIGRLHVVAALWVYIRLPMGDGVVHSGVGVLLGGMYGRQ